MSLQLLEVLAHTFLRAVLSAACWCMEWVAFPSSSLLGRVSGLAGAYHQGNPSALLLFAGSRWTAIPSTPMNHDGKMFTRKSRMPR